MGRAKRYWIKVIDLIQSWGHRMEQESAKKPSMPPGKATEKDVLDAIEQLTTQLHRWQPVTNTDVLDAVHGVTRQLANLQIDGIAAALQKLQTGEDTMSGSIDDLRAAAANIQSGLNTVSADQSRMADDLTQIAQKLASSGAPQDLVDQVNALAQQAQTTAQNADSLVQNADAMVNPPPQTPTPPQGQRQA